MTGRFIAFEGGEGSGKSTQAARLAARLGALLTHEPGDTPLVLTPELIIRESTAAPPEPTNSPHQEETHR